MLFHLLMIFASSVVMAFGVATIETLFWKVIWKPQDGGQID